MPNLAAGAGATLILQGADLGHSIPAGALTAVAARRTFVVDGAYAEKPKTAESETQENTEKEANSGSIVTTALPAPKLEEAA